MAISEVEWNHPMNYAVVFELGIKALEQCDVWEVPYGKHIVAPKGTFDKLFKYEEKEDDGI